MTVEGTIDRITMDTTTTIPATIGVTAATVAMEVMEVMGIIVMEVTDMMIIIVATDMAEVLMDMEVQLPSKQNSGFSL